MTPGRSGILRKATMGYKTITVIFAALILAPAAAGTNHQNQTGFACSLSGPGEVLIVEGTYAHVHQLCPPLAGATHLHLRWGLHVSGNGLPVATWVYRKGGMVVILQAEKLPALPALIRAYAAMFSPVSWRRVPPRFP
jgi:hypothetical protein